ncbi:MAG: FG-GAP-like repeat-containing protein [Candidatus Eiseniibacteriota bacterium]
MFPARPSRKPRGRALRLAGLLLGVVLSSPVYSAPNFGVRADFPAGSDPKVLQVADLNHDGKLDLVVAGRGSGGHPGSVRTFFGNALGGFSSGPEVPTPGKVVELALGDVDLDGNLDAAAVTTPPGGARYPDEGYGTLLLLHGAPDGGFTITDSDLVWLSEGTSVGIGRFFADEFPDVVLGASAPPPPGQSSFRGEVRVYAGNGSMELGPATVYDDARVVRGGMALGDLNGDGLLDFVQAISGTTVPAFWIAQDDETFLHASGLGTAGPSGIAIGELDGVAPLDVVLSSTQTTSLRLKRGGACCVETISAGRNASSVIAADLDADSWLDIVVSNHLHHSVTLVMGLGQGVFDTPVALATGAFPQEVVAGDWNGDALVDLAVVNSASESVTLYYQGNPTIVGVGSAPASLALSAPFPSPARGIAWADVTLGEGETASLEIVDVRGRIVNARTFSGGGTQRVSINEAGTMRPGVYWLRLRAQTAGSRAAQTRKFVVLE